MSFSISGKTAIVTGAANGVGLAIARHFADKGANVVFADLDEKRLKNEVGELISDEDNMRIFAGDLSEKLTVTNLLSATIDAFDRVDILVNASRKCEVSECLSSLEDAVTNSLQQNLLNSLRLSQAVAKRMIAQAAQDDDKVASIGAIINLSSIAARRAQADLLAYSISSAALDQMTRSLAVSLAPHRIRVNSVAFGSVMSASLQNKIREHDDYREEIVRHTPLGRIGSASEVAEAVQFLASEAASFMTGQIITVDGGRTLLDAVQVPAH
jgi:7-alpha-hydroxysteroid dehydrogenase